jgi:uncharacterized membrane-anchored protein YhcB (DUF1043 family)
MFDRVFKTKFDLSWWAGFLGAIVLVIVTIFEIINNNNIWIVLIYGILHMAILTFLGLKAIDEGKSNLDIGHRISTMGYLHTLIGTSIALILASNSSGQNILNQMNTIIMPIGSALITSIIGWAVGTEIERGIHGTGKEETIVDESLKNLSKNIDSLGKNLDKASEKWSKHIDNSIKNLDNSTKDLGKKYEEALFNSSKELDNNAQRIMDKYLIAFEGLFREMRNQAEEVKRNFKESNESAIEVIEELSSSYQKLLTQTQANVKGLEERLNKSVDSTNKSINNFTIAFNTLFNTMETYSDSMKDGFKTSSDNAKKTMDELSISFNKAFEQIGVLSKEWEKHIVDMKSFSKESNISLKDLLNNSKQIVNDIKMVADGMPNSVQILREVEDVLKILMMIKEDKL